MLVCPSCGRETPEGFPRCANCGAELAVEPGRQERKVVTVLFCDLVGFTTRSETMDPEDVRALLEPYHSNVRSELERFGGTVEKFIGDAVMAVFGAPVAHEDDPERAVRAALAIREWAREEGIELRIGVNTGEALVTIGGEPLATGDVVNTAARLQSAAPSAGVLVGETTYRATRDRIDFVEHEPVEAKGKAEPVPVWLAEQARSRVTVERMHAAALVGRSRELALLEDALARAKAERSAQLVTLAGVPGIGKSRLVYELFRHIEHGGELVSWRHGRCLPYGEGVTFWALGEIVKAQAGILETDSVDEVERKLNEAARDPWVESHLRPLVGLAAEEEAAGDRRVESFAAWRRFLENLAEERPMVVVFEDLHWAADDLLDFVDHLVDWASDVPLLVVCTARPELLERRPSWGGGKPNALTVSLSPLSDDETARLIAEVSERAVLPAETQEQLLAHAGGNPLYAEQYARMLAERGDTVAVPETLQGIVAARLDLLDAQAKRLLQAAAVLGRTFWAGGVAALTDLERAAVEERLHPLQRKDFVRREQRSAVANDTQYTFLHVVVRDVAHGQIPRAERAEQHRLAGEWIESLGRPDDHADLLAHHYLAALELGEAAGTEVSELAPRAARALALAGDRALALNAFGDARDLYRRALDLLPTADSTDRPMLLLKLSRALHRLTEGREIVADAARMLEAAGDVEGAAEAEMILADLAWHRGAREVSRSHLDRATSLLSDVPASPTKARVLSETSRYRMLAGENDEAIATGQEAIRMAEALALEFVRVHALINVGSAQATVGDPEGFRNLRLSIELSERMNSPEIGRAYNNLATSYASVGDLPACFDMWRRGLAAVERFGGFDMANWLKHQVDFPIPYVEGRWDEVLEAAEANLRGPVHYLRRSTYEHRGRIRLARGDVAGAVEDALAALEVARGVGDPQSIVPALSFGAFALLAAGRASEAGALADELLSRDALLQPVPHHAPWFDLAWVLIDLGRVSDLAAALARAEPRTRWVDPAEALASGDYAAAARFYAGVRSLPAEAYTRLRAARAGQAGAELEKAIAFFRQAGATAYLAQAEELAAASA